MKYNIFIAALLSPEQQQQVAKLISLAETKHSPKFPVNWSYEKDLHITLSYITKVDKKDIQILALGFSPLQQTKKFTCGFGQARLFGNAIVLLLEPASHFLQLHQFCYKNFSNLEDGKYPLENNQNYIPHLTLGHIKHPRHVSTQDRDEFICMMGENFSKDRLLIQQAACMQRIPSNLMQSRQTYWCHKTYLFE